MKTLILALLSPIWIPALVAGVLLAGIVMSLFMSAMLVYNIFSAFARGYV